jgi:hypothetical protein
MNLHLLCNLRSVSHCVSHCTACLTVLRVSLYYVSHCTTCLTVMTSCPLCPSRDTLNSNFHCMYALRTGKFQARHLLGYQTVCNEKETVFVISRYLSNISRQSGHCNTDIARLSLVALSTFFCVYSIR